MATTPTATTTPEPAPTSFLAQLYRRFSFRKPVSTALAPAASPAATSPPAPASAPTFDLTKAIESLIARRDLDKDTVTRIFEAVSRGECHPTQVAAFLVLLRAKGETGTEIGAAAAVLRARAVQLSPQPTPGPLPIVDVVGTGGDGHDTVNVSTMAAILASACGARVAKHGNKSASSKSGSGDVIQALGIPMLSARSIGRCIDRCGLAFIYAPNFHPALAHVAPVRKALGVKTVFNFLGPLLNPAFPRHMVIGVYSPAILEAYADAVQQLGAEHALIVHCGGLDELAAVPGEAHVLEVTASGVTRKVVNPVTEWLAPRIEIAQLKGGDAEENAAVVRKIMKGGKCPPELVPVRHTVALNAGAVLYVSGLYPSVSQGYKRALEMLEMGNEAEKQLDLWIATSNMMKEWEDNGFPE